MKNNKVLQLLCLVSLGFYTSQTVQASNPAYDATVNAKHGLGSSYNPAYNATVNAKHGLGSSYNPAYDATVNAKHGLGSSYNPAYNATVRKTNKGLGSSKSLSNKVEVPISGARWTIWGKSKGFYNPKNKTAELKTGNTVHRFYDVKTASGMSEITYGKPYVKFAYNKDTVFYGLKK